MSVTLTPPETSGTEAQQTLDHNLRVFLVVGWASIGLGALVLGFVMHQLFLTTWLAEANQGDLTRAAETRFATVEVTEVVYVPVPTVELPTLGGTAVPQVEDPAPRVASLLVEDAPAQADAFAIIRAPSLGRLGDGWTVVTKDRLPSAHFEHTIAVGKEKAEILTIPDLDS